MSSKDYLSQIKRYDAIIRNKMNEIAQCRELSVSLGSMSMEQDKVKSSGSKDKITDIVTKILELEQECKETIVKYLDIRKEVINTIEKVEDADMYDLLHKKYVDGMKLYEIASEMDISYDTARHMHKSALSEVGNILKNTK